MSLAQRLLAGVALVVAVLVLLIVVLSGGRLSRELEQWEVDDLARDARFVAAEWKPGVDAEALAKAAGAALGHRVTLIAPDGRVLGDSEFEGDALARLENHAGRPEVRAAMQGETGVSRRVSPSIGDQRLYVAVRAPLGVARLSIDTGQLDAIISRARRDVFASGFAALVAALLLAVVFARSVSRPIVELRDVARGLAAGDLSRRPALSAPGEIGDLADAVHRMAEQLELRLATLQSNDELMAALIDALQEGVVAVSAGRQVVIVNAPARRLLGIGDAVPFSADLLPRGFELREALAGALAGAPSEPAELVLGGRTVMLTARPLRDGGALLALLDLTRTRRLEAVRRDFVANVSHELKTPITVIGGFAETLATDDPPPEQRRRFVDAIRGNARRMQRLVDDLLDLSRIESGGWVPKPERVDLAMLASETVAAFAPAAEAAQVTLGTRIDARAATLTADATALRQVLSNLVDNAIRHTPAGGRVTILSEPASAGGVVLSVSDTGIGIPAEHLPRIFERFYRVDPARSRDAGGTGLGLAIVKHLVEAHGGRVTAESGAGRGTTVRAVFPPGAVTTS
ncbi:MAG TPA: ATP-binding protein [Gemmatimonadaceae bacterium]|nr:ATP-binding protein [Gemmatimonadaceae bacterium]